MRHRLAIASALLLALAGCSDDSPARKTSPSTTPATASPSPTATAPDLPKAATAETRIGGEAFVRYWFDVVTYAMRSGDTSVLTENAAQECTGCTNLAAAIDKIYRNGARTVGGGWSVTRLAIDARVRTPYRRFGLDLVQAPQELIDADGKLVDKDPRKPFSLWVTLIWRGGRWQTYESAPMS
jgi:ABC-type uncharacterized transport system auxiliary subunit